MAISTILLILCTNIISNGEVITGKDDDNNTVNTDIAQEKDKRLLLFATLDGMLTAVEQQTGRIQWKIKDSPIVQVPLNTPNTIVPIFLPDPRDGSLYLLDNSTEPLKKLPFTIPQLVSSSPCRSSDGILYTGKKKDTWFKLDPVTGNKQQILGWGNQNATCPVNPKTFVYVGRSKYNIKMIDSNKPDNKWNITFYDYSATAMNKEDLNNYDLAHFTSTSNGTLLTFDRRRGNLLWNNDLTSPVIRIYLLDSEGLISVPFTSMANYTITYLLKQLLIYNGHLQGLNQMRLYPALYIGEHKYGLYATTSLVDQNDAALIRPNNGPLLLGGPQASNSYESYPSPGQNYLLTKDFSHGDYHNFQRLPKFESNVLFTSHNNLPQFGENNFFKHVGVLKQITDQSYSQNFELSDRKPNRKGEQNLNGIQTKFMPREYTFHGDGRKSSVIILYYNVIYWINQQENVLKLVLITSVGCVIAIFWYLQIQIPGRIAIQNNTSNQRTAGSYRSTSLSEELPNGYVRIGKISFHPGQLLGKGCEGTFVYRGEFDNRQVAVKRLLPECFTFADREVALLRESDAHPHVIRYYCMEEDRMFRYIALELCEATLFDYIQGKCNISNIMPLNILQQATLGLSHLHSLDIVHRDIKPHNVLLSMPNNEGEVRAMISDFGLCKKLQVGKISFSRRSGVTGTDGWIAPEMLNGSKRTTYAVDLFSLGCLYYYVLSSGYHPFGDSLRRQANILKGDYNLSKLRGPEWQINIQKPLISALINSTPEQRPSCKAVLKHPMFWSYSKILSFFQDVSDRIEKTVVGDFVLQALENNGNLIVRMNWMMHIHREVISELKKYRSYHGDSVRDLLRALRNKKHHFQELSEETRKTFGEIPEDFMCYWINRFPLLLVHTWITIQCLANEKTFQNYYDETHRYSADYYKEQINLTNDSYSLSNQCSYIRTTEYKTNETLKTTRNISTQIDTTVQLKSKPNECLYRNFDVSEKVAKRMKEKLHKRSTKRSIKKQPKKVDEPLIWTTNCL